MKIALIIPRNGEPDDSSFYDLKFVSKFLFSKKSFAYLLAIPTLAALTPPEHEIRVFDENIEEIDYEWGPDLVGISVRTMFAKQAYSISNEFRTRGVKTVLGGIHPSMCTEEAMEHCDAVVVGEAEELWAGLLKDAAAGSLQKVYRAERKIDMHTTPPPRWSVLPRDKYLADIVQTTKGCPFHCEFCSVYAYDGQGIRNKSVDQVLQEVRGVTSSVGGYQKKAIFFADDNIIANRKFSRELFRELKKLKIKWSCQASINISKDEETLKLMRESGCGSMLIGLESVSEQNLARMDKGINKKHDYLQAIRTIQAHGILVNGSFIVGYDFDTKESFDELIAFINEAKLLMPLINVLTPFPGTKLFQRLEKEGRILHKDWSKYDSKQVVFSPALLTPEELQQGYRKVISEIYSFESIYKKLDHYMKIGFWATYNTEDPMKLKHQLLFAVRLLSLLPGGAPGRAGFIFKILPDIFKGR
ncbi:B12-binding domain-containing radical SAM protein, partial [bacterium]|nr:B12-binding domain-containing radical SAM protein [bacterium]